MSNLIKKAIIVDQDGQIHYWSHSDAQIKKFLKDKTEVLVYELDKGFYWARIETDEEYADLKELDIDELYPVRTRAAKLQEVK